MTKSWMNWSSIRGASLSIDYWLKDVTGSVHLQLAGENAAFSFHMEKIIMNLLGIREKEGSYE